MAVRASQAALCLVVVASCKPAPAPARDFAAERERMMQQQVAMRGVTEARLLAAMPKLPRDRFVPVSLRDLSYTDRVLEVGTGSGYRAAILAELAAQVYTIEIVAPLGARAHETVQRLGYKNVHVKIGDGYQGWAEYAPFDAVIVTCAPESMPRQLIEETREGGRLIIPVGAGGDQNLCLFEKKEGRP